MKANILTLAITLTLGVILAGSLLMPVIEDTQETIGPEVTYNNYVMTSNSYRYDYVDSVDVTATASATEGINYDYVINDQNITLISDYMLAVLSDGFSLQIGGAGQFAYAKTTDPYSSSYSNPTPNTYPTVTLKMADGEWILKGGDTEIASGTYTWIVTFVENGKYVAHNGSVVNAYCHKSPDDFIVYGSAYTSGDLDTYYAYGNGSMFWGVSDYEAKLNWAATLVDGTTDIYKVTSCNVTVSDGENSETFTPYRCLYLYEVTGHAASGAAYSLLGALPIIVIVGLVLAATAAIMVKRDD